MLEENVDVTDHSMAGYYDYATRNGDVGSFHDDI